MRMKKNKRAFFGTDGIRGEWGSKQLNKEIVSSLGYAIAKLFPQKKILIAKDTRISSDEIESLLVKSNQGISQIFLSGVMPTPGLSYTLNHSDFFDLGIMITASHNPYQDNGVKLFEATGKKISDSIQEKVEELMSYYLNKQITLEKNNFKAQSEEKSKKEYLSFLLETAKNDSLKNNNFHLLVDCANGAFSKIATMFFEQMPYKTSIINNKGDGKNINLNCGSTHIETIHKRHSDISYDLAVAFDGDGDRVLFADKEGDLYDGDFILWLLSNYFIKKGFVKKKAVVGTIMSNLALENELKKINIDFIRAQVGDRYVNQEILKHNAFLGGEPSGHIIIPSIQKSGDGLLTLIYFLKALDLIDWNLKAEKKNLNLKVQKNINLKVKEKRDLQEWKELNSAIKDFYERLDKKARIVVRYSGTEDKIRIMVEAQDEYIAQKELEKIIKVIEG